MERDLSNLKRNELIFSVVIPVFNSEKIVADTIGQTIQFFELQNYNYEIILVNDGSTDASWRVLADLAIKNKRVKAINLLHNYGQHNANLCGFQASVGDYVITMDDDLQNPPAEIEKLINTVLEGYDLVIGRFKEKKHSLFRRLGSKIIGTINRKVFYSEKGFVLTNFRIIHRDVIDRVCAYKSRVPYIPGLVVMFSKDRKNVLVEHHPRKEGKSNYSISKITKLVLTILFNYSSLPLRVMGAIGFTVSVISLMLALYYFISAVVAGTNVPGWSTLVIMVSFFNGFLILMVSLVGEYVIRLLRESGSSESYYVKEIIE